MFIWLSVVLLASVCLPLPGSDGEIAHIPPLCPFYHLTGLPCPGCGLTRAFVCLGHGHIRESLHWHPIGWLIYGVCLILWARAGLTWRRDRPVFPISAQAGSRLGWGALAGLLIVGAARIGWLLVGR